MRAFMSLTHDGARREPYYLPLYNRQTLAVREAHTILAVNEPIREGCSQADRMYRGPLATAPDHNARMALIEQLAAFVAEE